jgi:hypothetical protein
VLRIINPLLPLFPLLLVWIDIIPLDKELLYPLKRVNFPPALTADDPEDNSRSPPLPDKPEPTEM